MPIGPPGTDLAWVGCAVGMCHACCAAHAHSAVTAWDGTARFCPHPAAHASCGLLPRLPHRAPQSRMPGSMGGHHDGMHNRASSGGGSLSNASQRRGTQARQSKGSSSSGGSSALSPYAHEPKSSGGELQLIASAEPGDWAIAASFNDVPQHVGGCKKQE